LKFYPAQAPSNETIQNLVSNIATKTNNLLIRKKYLEKVEDMVLVGNTEEIFNDSGQHSHEDIHLPAQAASVTHRIAFGPNTGQPVRRLKSQTSLWYGPPSQMNGSSSKGLSPLASNSKVLGLMERTHFSLHTVNFWSDSLL